MNRTPSLFSFDQDNPNSFCFNATKTTSSGFFVGDDPFNFSFTLLLFQIVFIFVATRLVHAVLRPLGQPQVVSHVIAGIILGPSFLSRDENFKNRFFPRRSWIHLNIVSFLAYILFLFIIGVKTDLHVIRRSGKKAFALAWSTFLFPQLLIMFLSFAATISSSGPPTDLPEQLRFPNIIIFISRWTLTANPVIACLLAEQNLLSSKLGRLAMAASLIIDFSGIILRFFVFAVFTVDFSFLLLVWYLAAHTLLVVFIFVVARQLVMYMIRNTPEGEAMDEGYLVATILIALIGGLLAEVFGQGVAVGTLLIGLALPGGPPLGRTLAERLDGLVSGLLLPVYVAVAGIRMDLTKLVDARLCLYTVSVVGLSVLAKFGAAFGTSTWFGIPARDAVAVGLMLNCYGIVELYTFISWHDLKIIDEQMYTVCALLVISIGGIMASLLKLIYNPSSQFTGYHRLGIKKGGGGEELRILACPHDEHSTIPIMTVLKTTLPNPTCVYLLHLLPLVGQTNTVLAPYKKGRKKRSKTCSTDHIVNSFHTLELDSHGRLSVLPFITVSPYASMHNDICQLAIDKQIAVILLHFYRHSEKGAFESTKPAIRVMNMNVLHYAPCTVAIFIDHGLSRQKRLSRIAVYFLGGPDDREALAYASCMVDNEDISLTVIRLVLPEELRFGSYDDDEAVDEFEMMNVTNPRFGYTEEEVRDGPGTVDVIRRTSGNYDLLIVGRRYEETSAFTDGLEMWSEYPELGVVGDLLASTDLGSKVSTLVVQKQSNRKEQKAHTGYLNLHDDIEDSRQESQMF